MLGISTVMVENLTARYFFGIIGFNLVNNPTIDTCLGSNAFQLLHGSFVQNLLPSCGKPMDPIYYIVYYIILLTLSFSVLTLLTPSGRC